MSALGLLTGDASTFLAKVWASRTHVHHADQLVDQRELAGLLTLGDVDGLLTASAIRTPAVRVVRDGEVLPGTTFTRRGASLAGQPLSGLVDPRRALELFEQGATLVLQGLHRYHPALGDLVAELELELGHPCQANAYLTPPGAQGFALHSDAHDVFVVQTSGRKQWEIHGPDGAERLVLEPGVAMYLPAGTPHAARTQQEVSLHVTVGINQLTWRGLVRRSVERALAGVPDTHLPAGYLDDPGLLVEGLARQLAELGDAVRDLHPAVEAEAQVRRFLTTRPSRLGGGLVDATALATLADDTRLRRRRGHPCVLVDRGDRLEVLLGDRCLDVPSRLRPALEEVRSRGELCPADLSDHLDERSRLVLCRRLVREGLLELGPPVPVR